MRVAGFSDIGTRREKNEDAFWYDAQRGIFILADGLGAHQAGEVAAGMAIEIASSQIVAAVGSGFKEEALSDALQDAFVEASRVIHQTGLKDAELQGMACSLVAAVIADSECYIAHVGDTRAYLFFNNVLCQMTTDDTPVAALVKRGYLLPEKSRAHVWSNILLKTIGGRSNVDANLLKFPVKPNEKLLLCSDGLWATVDHSEMENTFASAPDPQSACWALVRYAHEKGAQDNITAIVVAVDETTDQMLLQRTQEIPPPFIG